MSAVAFGQLCLDKVALTAPEQIGIQPLVQFLGQRNIAKQVTVFQHGGANGEILAPQSQAIADGAAGVADLELEVPQDVERRLDHRLGPWRDLVGRQKQQIDIGKRRHLAPAITANGNHRQPFAIGGRRVGVHHLHCGAQGPADQTIGQKGVGPRRRARLERRGGKGIRDPLAGGLLGVAQMRDDHLARRGDVRPVQPVQQRIKGRLIKDVGPRADQGVSGPLKAVRAIRIRHRRTRLVPG